MMGVASGAVEKKLVSLSQSGDTLTWKGEANLLKSITPSSNPDPDVSWCRTFPLPTHTSTHMHEYIHASPCFLPFLSMPNRVGLYRPGRPHGGDPGEMTRTCVLTPSAAPLPPIPSPSLIAPQSCTAQLACTEPNKIFRSYPAGDYWSTCSNLEWGMENKKYVAVIANCETGQGSNKNHNQLHLPKCCRMVIALRYSRSLTYPPPPGR